MKNKKVDIWVSAVLYFGLGIIIISILLAAGLPVINRLKDKNIAIQTKESFHKIDENMREVIRGGPGTQRVLTVEIKKGDLSLLNNKIIWKYNSKVYLSEPSERNTCIVNLLSLTPIPDNCVKIKEGNIDIVTVKSQQKGTYDLYYVLDYSDLVYVKNNVKTITGVSDVVIKNDGVVADASGTACP